MDVRLPNGTVIKNVPEGTSKAQIQALAIRNGLAKEADFGAVPQAQESEDSGAMYSPEGIPLIATREMPTRQQVYQTIKPVIAPTVEALGSVAGGVLGAPAGPMGMLGGAGLGYGISKEALNLADIYFGGQAPRQGIQQVTEPIQNILEGATYEAAGRVAAPLIARGLGRVADVVLPSAPSSAQLKAGQIARETLGKDLPAVLDILKNAKPGQSVAEITASIENPTWQALVSNALERDPQFVRKVRMFGEDESLKALSKLAGGENAVKQL
jgi:hypothetical protein